MSVDAISEEDQTVKANPKILEKMGLDESRKFHLLLSSGSQRRAGGLASAAREQIQSFNKQKERGLISKEEQGEKEPEIRELKEVHRALSLLSENTPITPEQLTGALNFLGQEVKDARSRWTTEDSMKPGLRAARYLSLLGLEHEIVREAIETQKQS